MEEKKDYKRKAQTAPLTKEIIQILEVIKQQEQQEQIEKIKMMY